MSAEFTRAIEAEHAAFRRYWPDKPGKKGFIEKAADSYARDHVPELIREHVAQEAALRVLSELVGRRTPLVPAHVNLLVRQAGADVVREWLHRGRVKTESGHAERIALHPSGWPDATDIAAANELWDRFVGKLTPRQHRVFKLLIGDPEPKDRKRLRELSRAWKKKAALHPEKHLAPEKLARTDSGFAKVLGVTAQRFHRIKSRLREIWRRVRGAEFSIVTEE